MHLYVFGFTDEFVEQFTQYGYSYFDFKWYNAEGELVANTDDQFYKQIYGEIVRDYNEGYAKELGYQNELSLSVGADYYKYTPKNWFHFWATTYPITKGMSDYSFNYDVAENGMDWMYANCSTTAQRGALDWKNKFRDAVLPVFNDLYDSVASGNEAQRSIDSNSQPDYRVKLDAELSELHNSEMWKAGRTVRSLRPENQPVAKEQAVD